MVWTCSGALAWLCVLRGLPLVLVDASHGFPRLLVIGYRYAGPCTGFCRCWCHSRAPASHALTLGRPIPALHALVTRAQVQRELEAICLRKVGADATNVSCPGSGGNSGANSGCSSGSGSGKGEGLGVGSSRAGNGVSSSGSGLAGPHTTATGVAVAGNR